MKRYLIYYLFWLPLAAASQTWPGYNTSMYSGIHTLSYTPEIHSVMPADWDINVLSSNLTFFNENFFGWDPIGDIKDGNVHSVSDIFENQTGIINATIKFPSVAVRLNDKSTLGFSWDMRGLLFSKISSSDLSNFLNEIDKYTDDQASYNNDFARGILSTWSQYGFFYSREVLNRNRNKLYVGIKLNILSGFGSAYLDFSDLSFNYSDGILSDVNLTFKVGISEEADKLVSGKEIPLFKTFGLGTDIGITYEKLKNEQSGSSYYYKLGFSVTGLGKINYTNTTTINYVNLHSDYISKESFSNIESISQLRDTLESVFSLNIEDNSNMRSRLPININLYGDLNIYNRFYIHAAYKRQINYLGSEKYEDLCYSQYYIVPRYESKVIGVYMPFTYNKFLDLEAGIAFRWKPLVIGSGNIFSFFIKGESSTNLDIYFATRIMINRKKNKTP